MQTLYQSDYVNISYAPAEKILTYQWLESSTMMSNDIFQQEMLQLPNFSAELNPTGFLEDNRQRDFIIRPEIQAWISTKIAPLQFKSGTKYFALTNPPSYVAQMSTQQTMDEIKKHMKQDFHVAYFDEYTEAWEWICNHQAKVGKVSVV